MKTLNVTFSASGKDVQISYTSVFIFDLKALGRSNKIKCEQIYHKAISEMYFS